MLQSISEAPLSATVASLYLQSTIRNLSSTSGSLIDVVSSCALLSRLRKASYTMYSRMRRSQSSWISGSTLRSSAMFVPYSMGRSARDRGDRGVGHHVRSSTKSLSWVWCSHCLSRLPNAKSETNLRLGRIQHCAIIDFVQN